MLSIDRNGIICMSRGDSWKTSIFLNLGTILEPAAYNLKENDYVYFGVMEPNQPFEDALIRKKLGYEDRTPIDSASSCDIDKDNYKDGCVDIYFESKDTEYVLPGVYYYEVKLVRPVEDEGAKKRGITESIDTIIPKTKFIILD